MSAKLWTCGPWRTAASRRAGSIGFWPPWATKRAAEEGDRRGAVEQAELAEGIGEIDVDLADERLAAAALGDRQPACGERGADRIAAVRVARHDDGEHVRETRSRRSRWASATISSSPSWVEAATHTGRWPMAERKPLQLAGVGGERRRVELEVAGDGDLVGAESAEAGAVLLRLGEAKADAREEATGDGRRSAASRGTSGPTGVPLTTTSGTTFSSSRVMIVGHSSDSTKMTNSGRQ